MQHTADTAATHYEIITSNEVALAGQISEKLLSEVNTVRKIATLSPELNNPRDSPVNDDVEKESYHEQMRNLIKNKTNIKSYENLCTFLRITR